MATAAAGDRIVTLDVVRGVAVMGILVVNIISFAMPEGAGMNPLLYGMNGAADFVSWAVSFVFFEGRMRGLFSFLFGASMLLVIERAEAGGRSPARVHYARMGWLLVFGLLHFFFVWMGDILSLYAVIGMIAFAFRDSSRGSMLAMAGAMLLLNFALYGLLTASLYASEAMAAQPGASAELQEAWRQSQSGVGYYDPAHLQSILALYRGPYDALLHHVVAAAPSRLSWEVLLAGPETLAYFLFGMAAYRSGFLTGAWERRRYLRAVLIGFGISLPAFAALAWLLAATGFHPPTVFAVETASIPVRPPAIFATAALIILLARPGGFLTDRIAAAGRAAFTNYLGTSILMTGLFYGWGAGLFGYFSRAELWWFVIGACLLMLLWSKPWLDRFRYGPFEWAWRSLSRGRVEPLKRA
ncbi:MAG: DUF418 domain-containing protein [Allosphingosinicella sp.]|uniref:DUF418 domain-containing protein n=1 Tax=Allosphingosinicella sp. TaxID=2823234 RepID=UPI00394B3DA2